MRTGRPKAEVPVTSEERDARERRARRAKTAQALAQRARIVLGCATGATNRSVAARGGSRSRWSGNGAPALSAGGSTACSMSPVPARRGGWRRRMWNAS